MAVPKNIEDRLNKLTNMEKPQAINDLINKFNLKEQVAKRYYSEWRKNFMETGKYFKKVGNKYKGLNVEFEIKDGKIVCGEEEFKTTRDIRDYRTREINQFESMLLEIEDAIKLFL